jgi:hypothetical protein
MLVPANKRPTKIRTPVGPTKPVVGNFVGLGVGVEIILVGVAVGASVGSGVGIKIVGTNVGAEVADGVLIKARPEFVVLTVKFLDKVFDPCWTFNT